MHVYIYIYIYVANVYMHIYTDSCEYIHIHSRRWAINLLWCVPVYLLYMYIHINMYIHLYIYLYTWRMYINKYVFIHLNIYIYTGDDGQLICCDSCPRTFCFDCARLAKEPRGKRLYLYMFVCMYVCLYGYESIAICLYIHILMSAREGTILYMYECLSV